jgi:ABC-type Mn2+/Zn2+ transport system permease subunit
MINWFVEPFASGIVREALYYLIALSLITAVLGVWMVLRGLAFIVDGLAHAILPGVAVSILLGGSVFIGALVAALVVTLLINFTIRQNVNEDSAISIFFTGFFSLGLILVSSALAGRQGASATNLLIGQLFGVKSEDLITALLVGGLVLVTFVAFRKEILLASFDPTMAKGLGYPVALLNLLIYVGLAVAIVVALPAVGNLLILAFLITPAATARLLTDQLLPMMLISFVIGVLAGFFGLVFSFHFDLAGGAAVVVVSAIFYLLVLFFAPTNGILKRNLSKLYQVLKSSGYL